MRLTRKCSDCGTRYMPLLTTVYSYCRRCGANNWDVEWSRKNGSAFNIPTRIEYGISVTAPSVAYAQHEPYNDLWFLTYTPLSSTNSIAIAYVTHAGVVEEFLRLKQAGVLPKDAILKSDGPTERYPTAGA